MRRSLGPLFLAVSVLVQACSMVFENFEEFVEQDSPVQFQTETSEIFETDAAPAQEEQETDSHHPSRDPGFDIWDLWQDGPHLRGANIYQRRVYPELDGPTFMGPGPVGPPYTLSDLQSLSAQGANLVNISHPGLFTETPPYELDTSIQSNLDQLLDWALEADLFVVIAFRTGPGRSEFTFLLEDLGDWFDSTYLNDSVWEDAEAQAGWAAMWRYTAERYHGHPALAGYDLMVEPNVNEVLFDEWDQDIYEELVAGTTADWNGFYPQIAAAIREVDPDTPILVEPSGYGAVDWLPLLEPVPVERLVIAAHQYAPYIYTNQSPYDSTLAYPGFFDTDWDDETDSFDSDWFDTMLLPMDSFKEEYGLPMAVNEYGAQRWTPGAAQFLDAEISEFEERGLNHAVWLWEVSYEEYAREVTEFQIRLGPDPDAVDEITTSEILGVLQKYWANNTIRPSNASR